MAVEPTIKPDVLRLEIDKYRLDVEWQMQPQQMYVWAKKAADAQLALNSAKSSLDLIDAGLDKEIRDNPETFEISKLTNEVVTKTIETQPPHVAAVRKVNEAHHVLRIAEAAVNALEHRKRALTMLVELWVKDYYSDKSRNTPAALSEEGGDFNKEAVRNRGARRRALMEEDRDTDGDDD